MISVSIHVGEACKDIFDLYLLNANAKESQLERVV